MKRILEYYIGKPCKMDIGADGQIVWAVGRISGEIEGSTTELSVLKTPSAVYWTTPHGSTFETGFNQLYELDKGDKELLLHYENKAKATHGILFYGSRLNEVSHETMKKSLE